MKGSPVRIRASALSEAPVSIGGFVVSGRDPDAPCRWVATLVATGRTAQRAGCGRADRLCNARAPLLI